MELHEYSMREMLTRLLCLALATQLLFACSTLQQAGPVSDTASFQNQRAASAELALLDFKGIDALIKLNNRILSNHIEAAIKTQTNSTGQYTIRKSKLAFKRQFIYLELLIDVLDEDKNIISALLSGEVLLHFSGDRLEWFPHFTKLKINSRNFNFQGEYFSEPTAEITQFALQKFNSDISEFLIKQNNNSIPLVTVPLGEVRVGASLPGLSPSPALLTGSLTGTTRVVDSLILIDSTVTSIALNLEFTPNRTPCPSGSDCTMYAEPAFDPEPEPIITHVNVAEARQSFAVLKDEFETRTGEFSISEEKPDIALIEIRRSFLHHALQASLAELNMDAQFSTADLSVPEFSALLRPIDTDKIMCEPRECPSLPVCKADLTQCKRLRDTRDCSSCTFRNPLNNRCVREETDPVCESERSLQNNRFGAERAACISNAENLKRDCDETNAQALLGCQLGSDSDLSGCESIKRKIRNLKTGTSLASVHAQVQASGTLIANFSNFRIEGDLKQLKLDMALKSDLQLKGKLDFKPDNPKRPLADCIAAWNAPFSSRVTTTSTVNNLISDFEDSSNNLTANWSGFGLTIHAAPSPLESILASNPGLLSNCKIGLTMSMVERALAGDDAGFFLGQLNLAIQPSPTTIHFAPATITLGNSVYSSDVRILSRNLRFEISD